MKFFDVQVMKKTIKYKILNTLTVLCLISSLPLLANSYDIPSSNEMFETAFFESSQEVSAANVVYITPNGKCYHSTRRCPTLHKSKKVSSVALKDAQRTRRACKVCH